MSKPSIRIIVSVLIGLAILLAVYASVQAASPTARTSQGRLVLTAGLMPDLSHPREAIQIQPVYSPQMEDGSGHHCDDEAYNPNDD